jgi:hypothetical protein
MCLGLLWSYICGRNCNPNKAFQDFLPGHLPGEFSGEYKGLSDES